MSTNVGNDPEFNDVIPKPNPRRRFSIVRVLMVLGIIAVLVALFLPVQRTAPRAMRRVQCTKNLRQIALALLDYEQEYKSFPPAYTVDARGRALHSWRTLILPYLDNSSLFNTVDLSKPWNDPANAQALATMPSIFRCPEAVEPRNTTTYLAIVAPNGCLISSEPRRLVEITDPHQATLMVIEAGEESAVPWMAPVDANESLVLNLGPTTKLHHAGGTNACFVDGGVTFLESTTPAEVRRALMSIAGNDNEVAKDW